MPQLLVLCHCTDHAAPLQRSLARAGLACEVLAGAQAAGRQLGAQGAGSAPQQVVAVGEGAESLLGEQLAAWAGEPPCPVSWIAPAPAPGALQALIAQGLAGWWPERLLQAPDELRAALAQDGVRWQRDTGQRTELARLRGQLDERIWVDRAKGVLMGARGMGEDEAFRLLRGASMQTNLRVGEVSRSVIEAAQWADAINRAGQLRMLSQRLVKLAAQRLAGVDARRARTVQDEAALRTQDNLNHLAALPMLVEAGAAAELLRPPLAATTQAWAALQSALVQRQTPAALQVADQRAEALLAAAEALTEALDSLGARRALHIVNLCGRQRMRVQRLAKQALLASLLQRPERRDALPPLMDEFEAALLELERAPLSSAEIRDTLASAREEWLRLLRGLRAADGAEGQGALARSSDALLDLFDRLTASYEHSLQVIMS